MENRRLEHSQRNLVLAGVAFVLAGGLWQVQGLSFITYPFRLFVTMIHEMGHGLGALLTGGDFVRFEVTSRGAGLAYTSGGSRAVVIQAGYVGTALFGALLLILTHRAPRPRLLAVGVGCLVGVLTLLYTGLSVDRLSTIELGFAGGVLAVSGFRLLTGDGDRERWQGVIGLAAGGVLVLVFAGDGNWLTVGVGLASALVLVLIGLLGSPPLLIGTLTFLAFLTGLQAITDAWVLLKIVSLPEAIMPHNDAMSMAREFGGSAALWAWVWIIMDMVIFGIALNYALITPWRASRRS